MHHSDAAVSAGSARRRRAVRTDHDVSRQFPIQTSTDIRGTLNVVSNTSVANQTQLIGAFPYTYTVGPADP